VGNAPKEKYKEDLELLVRRLGLERTIEFVDATGDVPSVMRALDLLVSATITPEAFGRVVIEAHASGVPVVATKVGGIVDIIEDGATGLLCSPGNPADMAEKIMRIYKDRPLRSSLASESRRRVEKDFNLAAMMERTVAVYEEALRVRNILVIKIGAIGDVILAVPSLKALRAKFPDAKIKVLVGVQSREALGRCPYINDLIVSDFKGKDGSLRGLLRVAGELRKNCFDIAIDLQNNRKSHILAALSLAPERYGYDNGKLSFLLNNSIKDDAPFLDPIEHQFRTLKLAGVKPVEKALELWTSASDEEAAKKFLADSWVKESQALIGINVRASSRWETKNWPPAYIAELCDRLAKELNIRAVLTGAKNDAGFAEEIAKLTKSKPIIAAGKTSLMELAALVRHFSVYLTPDSAPMHIAAAVGTPFVALFGPTDPARHLAPSDNRIVLCKSGELKCSPCYNPNCSRNLACMKKITVDEVMSALKGFL